MRPVIPALALLLLAVAPSLAAASADLSVPAARTAPLSLEQAVALVQRRTGARDVRADELHEGEQIIYRLRLLAADGRVMTVRVSAATGQVD